jgi:hypothetical protein
MMGFDEIIVEFNQNIDETIDETKKERILLNLKNKEKEIWDIVCEFYESSKGPMDKRADSCSGMLWGNRGCPLSGGVSGEHLRTDTPGSRSLCRKNYAV